MIKIIKVKNSQEGIVACKKLLYEIVSKNTALFLSGGSTPKNLYEILAKEKKLNIGAVAMVDERFIQNHESRIMKHDLLGTNEYMIRQTGLVKYLEKEKIRFYPILSENENIKNTALQYEETVRFLFNHFPKSVGILGIGIDGHTAGIPARIQNSKFKTQNKTDLVTSFESFPGEFKKRITLTFLGLSKLDKIIILAFGEEKKKALKLMFAPGSVYEIPARFFAQKEISRETILITDQII